MPAIASGGATNPSKGVLVFGIGTETNNALGSATVLPASDSDGFILASYNGTTNLNAALDSGSNATFFTDSTIPTCTDNASFYCPTSTLNLTATLTGTEQHHGDRGLYGRERRQCLQRQPDGDRNAWPEWTNRRSCRATTSRSSSISGCRSSSGRNVFTAIENQTTPGGTGPYYAF